MAYIGIKPAESFTSFATQTFSTSATSSYTLDHAVTNENEIALFVNNVRQQPGSGKAYTATGTALTLSANTKINIAHSMPITFQMLSILFSILDTLDCKCVR